MQVKSIAECSQGAFCNTFDLHLIFRLFFLKKSQFTLENSKFEMKFKKKFLAENWNKIFWVGPIFQGRKQGETNKILI